MECVCWALLWGGLLLRAPGRAAQVDPIKSTLKASGTERLKLKTEN